MTFVNLVSGGLDSTLIGVLAKENEVDHFPLFIDYGQLAAEREWKTCQAVHKQLGLPVPQKVELAGYGKFIASGLTRPDLDIRLQAFTPGRNLMFLLIGSAYAVQLSVNSVAIGLLSEQFSLFPDQEKVFITKAEDAISTAMGRPVQILTPLIEFSKADVVRLAEAKGVEGTYSCHTGNVEPCGRCIACLEFPPP